MVKEKGKSGKTKKNVVKKNWDEDDISVTHSDVLGGKKKKSENTMENFGAATKKNMKSGKVKKKMVRKGAKKTSDDDDFGASLNKLKEIDPEFYKVMPSAVHFIFLY